MALNNMGLGFVFTARDAASAKFGRVGTSFGALDQRVGTGTASIGHNLGRLKIAFGAFAAGAVGLVASLSLADPAGKFDQAIAKVGAISRASAEDLQLLERSALDAGIATQFSPREAADGLAELAAQGFSATESVKALIPALDLAAGGQISVSEATKAATAGIKVFGLEVEDAGAVADKMLRISNATALQARDLGLAMGTVGRGASAAKQSLDEMLPAMGLVKNTGVDASVAASSVSSALLFMADNAQKFRKIGVDVADANGKFRPFLDVVMDTQEALSGLTDTQRVAKAKKLFGRFGLTAFSAISGQLGKGIKNASGEMLRGAKAVDFLRQTMAGAGGAAEEFREKLLSNFEGQKTLIKGSLQTLAIAAGQPFAKVLAPIVTGLIGLINSLIKLIKIIPTPIKRFAAGLFVLASALTMVVGGVLAMKFAISFIGPAIAAAAFAVAEMVAAAWPFVLAAGAIVAAVVALRAAISANLGGIGDVFRATFARIQLAWQAVTQLIRDGAFSGAVLEELDKVGNRGVKEFAKSVFGIFYRVKRFFLGLAGAFNEAVAPAVEGISDAFGFLADKVSELVNEIVGPASDGLKRFSLTNSQYFHSFGAVIGAVFGGIARVIGFALEVFVRFFGAIAWGVRKVVQGVKWLFGRLQEFGGMLGDWAFNIAQRFQAPFKAAAEQIMAFLEPVIGFFDALSDRILAGLVKLRDSMIVMARKTPTWLRTESVERFAALETTQEQQSGEALRATVASLPASQQARIQTAQAEATSAGIGEIGEKLVQMAQIFADAQGGDVIVSVDGEAIASAGRRADRLAAERSFSAVPVY